MEFIINNWKHYFEHMDEGLGTIYERFVLHQHFDRIRKNFSVQSVLDAPSFGITGISGINSMWWACTGAAVTIVDCVKERLELTQSLWEETGLRAGFVCAPDAYVPLPFGDKSYDMSWSFAGLGFVANLEDFLRELTRVTQAVILICVPNRYSVGYLMQSRGDHFGWARENLEQERVLAIMNGLGWQAREGGYLDAPPWPDIGMRKEDFLKKLGFQKLATKLKQAIEKPCCILDYYKGVKPEMEREFLKYGFLETCPDLLKKFWAHHRYFVFTEQ